MKNINNIKSSEELINFLVQIRSIIWKSGEIYNTKTLLGKYKKLLGYFQGIYIDRGSMVIGNIINKLGIMDHHKINNEVKKRLRQFEK